MTRPVTLRKAGPDDTFRLMGVLENTRSRIDSHALELLALEGTVWCADDPDNELPVAFIAAGTLEGALTIEIIAIRKAWLEQGLDLILLDAVLNYARWAYFGSVIAFPQFESDADVFRKRGFMPLDMPRLSAVLQQRAGAAIVWGKRL